MRKTWREPGGGEGRRSHRFARDSVSLRCTARGEQLTKKTWRKLHDPLDNPHRRCSAWLGRVVCGDNTEVLSGFPDACIDLVVTSPPYDDLRTYGGHSWNFETLAAQLVRVLKPGGVIVWVVGDMTEDGSETGNAMRQALHLKDVCGLRLHDTMIYQKTGIPFPESARYNQEWEYCFVMSKGKPKTFNQLRIPTTHKRNTPAATRQRDGTMQATKYETGKDDRARGNVWRYNTGFMRSSPDAIAFDHPAVFPEALAKDHIASWSSPGDVVLDPFSGSGTTCKSAKELNRQWCGIEINPEYCAIAEARMSQDVLQLETCAMRPNDQAQR